MKLIIDIDKNIYSDVIIDDCFNGYNICKVKDSIKNGTPLEEELEMIKAEIENIPNDETTKPIGTYDYCLGAENERKIVLQILYKHISELKGE